MESEDVDAESVRKTGDKARRAKKTRTEDLNVFAPSIPYFQHTVPHETMVLTLFFVDFIPEYIPLEKFPKDETEQEHTDGYPDEDTRIPGFIV